MGRVKFHDSGLKARAYLISSARGARDLCIRPRGWPGENSRTLLTTNSREIITHRQSGVKREKERAEILAHSRNRAA